MLFSQYTENCPSCGADIRLSVSAKLAESSSLSIASTKSNGAALPITAKVCSRCGNIQFSVWAGAFREDQDITDAMMRENIEKLKL